MKWKSKNSKILVTLNFRIVKFPISCVSQSSADNNSLAYFVSEHKIPLDPIIYLSPMAGILSEYFWWDSNIWIGRNGHLLVSLTSDLSYTIQNTNTNTKYRIKVQNTNATLWSSFTWWHTFGCKYKLRFEHLNWKKRSLWLEICHQGIWWNWMVSLYMQRAAWWAMNSLKFDVDEAGDRSEPSNIFVCLYFKLSKIRQRQVFRQELNNHLQGTVVRKICSLSIF